MEPSESRWGNELFDTFSNSLNKSLYRSKAQDVSKIFDNLIDSNQEKLNTIQNVDEMAIFLFKKYKEMKINEALGKLTVPLSDELKIELIDIGDYEIDSLHALFTRKCLLNTMKSHSQQLGNRINSNYKIELHILKGFKK